MRSFLTGMRLFMLVSIVVLSTLGARASAQQISAPEAQPATLVGTVTDVTGQVIPEASVAINSANGSEHHTLTADGGGFFSAADLHPGVAYHVVVTAPGFAQWSKDITLTPGQYLEVTGIQLGVAAVVTSVQAVLDTTEIAVQQVHVQEEQKVLGFIPNFYTTYEKHPAPMTAKLKFELAFHTEFNPITFLGVGFISAIDQAADSTPHYQQGWAGYGQRYGANYATGFTDILFGGAVLPSLLHQDPRYYYQGEGSTKSRLKHALSNAFIAHGDNGELQPNYSSMGGFLISAALAETYIPDRDRGAGVIGSTFAINLAANMANGVIQEFILRKFTPSAKKQP